jgi:hypothetical protein
MRVVAEDIGVGVGNPGVYSHDVLERVVSIPR